MEKTEKNEVLVSIIIPVFNSEKYLVECIMSICTQTYRNLEIIIINDGSTDGSPNILNTYAEKDTRVKVITIPNSGVSIARNTGLDCAKGTYISFVDSDDLIQNDMVERLVRAMENKDYGMAISGIRMCYSKRKRIKYVNYLPGIDYVKNKEDFERTFPYFYQCKSYLSPCAKLYRRSIIEQRNIRFREHINLGEDMLFNYDYLGCDFTSIIINEPLYIYRIGEKNSLTQNYSKQRLFNNEMLFYESVKFMEKYGIHSMFEPIAKYYFISCILVIQSYLRNKKECRQVIQHILNAKATKYACQKYKVCDLELKCYQNVFQSRSIYKIYVVAYARYLAKKILR